MSINKIKNNAFEDLFLHSKPVKMLTSLKNENIQYASQVSKYVDCTYSHTVKVLEMFKDLGLVTFDKKGRVKLIKLTNEGEEVAHNFEGVRKKFFHLASQFKEVPVKKEVPQPKKK